MRTPRLLTAVVALIATGAASAAASASPPPVDSGAVDSGAGDSGTPERAAFPVTIATKYGDVTIPEEPQRVVSVGYTEQDGLLALGVVPVGIREWFGEQPYATWPWALDELGDAEPTVLSSAETGFEAVAALDPDLIVGVSSGMTEQEFQTLSDIAPTIAQSGDFPDYQMPWRDSFLMLAEAVGRTETAEGIIADIEQRLATVREEHPEFAGLTANVAFFYDDQPGAYSSGDSRPQFLAELGFVTPPEIDELAGDAFFVSLSSENVALLDADVLVWITSEGTGLEAAQNVVGREALTAYQEGREVFIDGELSAAFSFNSPLSLPYVLDHFVPMLAAAADGDADTPVPTEAADAAPESAAATDTAA